MGLSASRTITSCPLVLNDHKSPAPQLDKEASPRQNETEQSDSLADPIKLMDASRVKALTLVPGAVRTSAENLFYALFKDCATYHSFIRLGHRRTEYPDFVRWPLFSYKTDCIVFSCHRHDPLSSDQILPSEDLVCHQVANILWGGHGGAQQQDCFDVFIICVSITPTTTRIVYKTCVSSYPFLKANRTIPPYYIQTMPREVGWKGARGWIDAMLQDEVAFHSES